MRQHPITHQSHVEPHLSLRQEVQVQLLNQRDGPSQSPTASTVRFTLILPLDGEEVAQAPKCLLGRVGDGVIV